MKKLSFLIIVFIVGISFQALGQSLSDNLEEYYNFDQSNVLIDQEPLNPINSTTGSNISLFSSLSGHGMAYEFDINQIVKFPSHVNWIIDNNTNLSISFWAVFDNVTPGVWANIFGNANDYSLQFKKLANGNYVLHWWAGGDPSFTPEFSLPSGWNHYVMSKSGANNIKFYRNGVEIYSGQPAAIIGERGRDKNMYIGNDESVEAFKGRIDELGIWKRALNQYDVTHLYNSGSGITYPFIELIPVQSISLPQSSISVTQGTLTYVYPTFTPTNATNKVVTRASSNTSVVHVGGTDNSGGSITAKATGSAIITFTTQDGGKQATCTVNVTPIAIPSGLSNSSITSNGFTASWNSTGDYCGYTIEVSTNSSFSNIIYSKVVLDTIDIVTGLNAGTTYYWHVRSEYSSYQSNYSNSNNITTSGTANCTITLTQTTGGTISSSVSNCNAGSSVTFSATTEPGYQFSSWNGITAATNPVEVIINSNVIVSATFTASTGTNYWKPGTGGIYYNSGNVGIGTDTPRGIIQVSNYRPIIFDIHGGNGIYGSSIGFNSILNTSVVPNKFTKLGGTVQNGGSTIVSDYEGSLSFQMYNAGIETEATINYEPQVVFKYNGNVGIGCTDPKVKLAVDGTIKAARIEVLTGPCADYVFSADYKLMNLAELDKFIKANKHLPEVPSAKEFQENGYNVGDMDNLLLQKVEELTLYILNLEKKTSDQNSTIIEQNAKIEQLVKKVDQLENQK